MRNRYMQRGVVLLLAGIVVNVIGLFIKTEEWEIAGYKIKYGWLLILGVLLFGAGFLYVLYSLIRKVERHAILEERAIEKENGASSPGNQK